MPTDRAADTVVLAALAVAATGLLAGDALAAPGRFRVLYSEPVDIEGLDARPTRARFDAYGRRFDLLLETNSRLVANLDPATRAAATEVRLLRGRLDGTPDSWVRLTVDGARKSGLVWDGRELYVIEPARDVAPRAVQPLNAAGDAPVVYRLSDTLSDPGAGTCRAVRTGLPTRPTSGLAEYEALVGELRQVAAANGVTGRLPVSAIADHEYFLFSGSEQSARNRVLAIMNDVDGIFSAQVGIEIELTGSIPVFQDPQDPFAATDGEQLLEELGDYRASQPTLRNTGLTHLVTGRDLDGSAVGIAYVGALCLSSFGVSLTQGTSGLASLIAAHEVGHNFGAPHDGEAAEAGQPPNPCESTPTTFLMAPRLNGNDQFSACSLTQMEPEIRQASCILPVASSADLSLAASSTSVGVTRGQTFPLGASVANAGGLDGSAVQLTFVLPTGLVAIDGTATNGGSCTTLAGGIGCSWPTLGAGLTSAVTVNVRADAAGTYAVAATLTAADDASSGNDALNYQVTVATPAPTPTGGGGGGGGGAVGALALALLAALGVGRRRPVRIDRALRAPVTPAT